MKRWELKVFLGLAIALTACTQPEDDTLPNYTTTGLTCVANATLANGGSLLPSSTVTLGNLNLSISSSGAAPYTITIPGMAPLSYSSASFSYAGTFSASTDATSTITTSVSVTDASGNTGTCPIVVSGALGSSCTASATLVSGAVAVNSTAVLSNLSVTLSSATTGNYVYSVPGLGSLNSTAASVSYPSSFSVPIGTTGVLPNVTVTSAGASYATCAISVTGSGTSQLSVIPNPASASAPVGSPIQLTATLPNSTGAIFNFQIMSPTNGSAGMALISSTGTGVANFISQVAGNVSVQVTATSSTGQVLGSGTFTLTFTAPINQASPGVLVTDATLGNFFQNIPTNTNPASACVTFQNVGGTAVTTLGVAAAMNAPFTLIPAAGVCSNQACQGSLAVGASCGIAIQFAPTSSGVFSSPLALTYFDGYQTQNPPLTVVGTSASPVDMWNTSPTPDQVNVTDSQSVELGVEFTVAVSGYVQGIQFYRCSQDKGSHPVTLWTGSGTVLASALQSNSGSGWQTVMFSQPVAVTAGTHYVASYHSNGFYGASRNFFTSSFTSGPFFVPSNGGVFTYSNNPTLPTSSWESSNYWIDVIFVQ